MDGTYLGAQEERLDSYLVVFETRSWHGMLLVDPAPSYLGTS